MNLSPSEPGSLLIWTYRDVAAEHHKGAAYQHRCYLLRSFHRGPRSPIRTPRRTPPPPLDSDQGHLQWVKRDGTTSLLIRPSPSALRRLRLARKNLDKHSNISVLLAIQFFESVCDPMGADKGSQIQVATSSLNSL